MAIQVLTVCILFSGAFGRYALPTPYPIVLTVCILFSGAFGRYALPTPYPIKPVNYEFGYGVKDVYSGLDHARQEEAVVDPYTGHNVMGRYHVLLPDGRLQVVTYKADENGYRAEVNYEEAPYHQPPPIVKTYSPAHAHPHHHHPAPTPPAAYRPLPLPHHPSVYHHLPSHNLHHLPHHPTHHLPFQYAPHHIHGLPLPFPANTYHLATTEAPVVVGVPVVPGIEYVDQSVEDELDSAENEQVDIVEAVVDVDPVSEEEKPEEIVEAVVVEEPAVEPEVKSVVDEIPESIPEKVDSEIVTEAVEASTDTPTKTVD